MMKFSELASEPCSISRALSVLGERWTLVVLKHAFGGTRRFDDFVAATNMSRSRLTDRLNKLVDNGLLDRVAIEGSRSRYEYRLSDAGRATYPILMALRDWGDTYAAPDGTPIYYLHQDCGGPATLNLVCGKCQEPLDAGSITATPGPGLTA